MFLTYDASRIDGMTGSIKLEEMSYIERMRKMKDFQFKIGKDGDAESLMDNFDAMLNMVQFTLSKVKEVDIAYKNGEVAKSLDDLNYKRAFSPIMQDLASFYFHSGNVGNS